MKVFGLIGMRRIDIEWCVVVFDRFLWFDVDFFLVCIFISEGLFGFIIMVYGVDFIIIFKCYFYFIY